MAESITTDSRPSYGVTFERTISDGNYGSNKFSAWVSADVAPDATETQKYDALADAARVAKALVFDQLGVDAHADEAQVIRETVKRVERAFPGTTELPAAQVPVTDARASAGSLSGAVRVKGQQHGELPSWLIEAAGKDGVTEVYDNRGDLSDPAKAKRPHFKATSGGAEAKAYWPPSNRR